MVHPCAVSTRIPHLPLGADEVLQCKFDDAGGGLALLRSVRWHRCFDADDEQKIHVKEGKQVLGTQVICIDLGQFRGKYIYTQE